MEHVQARESAALRETLQAEREASSAELEALRATVQKLEGEIRQRPPPRPVVSEEEEEERRRAGEKSTQEILRLKKVLFTRPVRGGALVFTRRCSRIALVSLVFKELRALQTEKEALCNEAEELSARLLELQKEKDGKIELFVGSPGVRLLHNTEDPPPG